MIENKILFTGVLGVGISTTIKNISDTEIETVQDKISDSNGNEVSVEMEHGILQLDTGDQIHLYGAPNREAENLVLETLGKDYIGMILLIDNSSAEPIKCLLDNIEDYKELASNDAIAVGLTNYDKNPLPEINEFHIALRDSKIHSPIFAIDVQNKQDIITLLKSLLYNLDSGIN